MLIGVVRPLDRRRSISPMLTPLPGGHVEQDLAQRVGRTVPATASVGH